MRLGHIVRGFEDLAEAWEQGLSREATCCGPHLDRIAMCAIMVTDEDNVASSTLVGNVVAEIQRRKPWQ